MENLRFAGGDDDDEDPYTGFDTVHPALDTRHLESDQGFQEAVRTSYGRRPPVSFFFRTTMFSNSIAPNPLLLSCLIMT